MSILIFIIMLVVLIVGHEFGHFVAAKLSKMKVLEFGVGFPPKLWGKKIGETEYTLNALPFGGFVKIFGEDAEEKGSTHDARDAFYNKPKVLQLATLVAGPFANLVIAFVLTSLAFMVGVPTALDPDEALQVPDAHVIIAEVFPGSPAELAGLMPGDTLASVESDGVVTTLTTPEQFSSVIESSADAVSVTYTRGQETGTVEIAAEAGVVPEIPDRRAIGVSTALVGTLVLPPHEALAAGFTQTIDNTLFIAVGIAKFIGSALSFSADFSEVSGPVGIVSSVGDAATYGVGSLFIFAALISINLFIINLLPFPALDGGRIAFVAVETVIRRRIPAVVANSLNLAGFALLILLMIAVTVSDVSRLVGS